MCYVKHIKSKYGIRNGHQMAKLSRKRSWVIPRDCMPKSNSLKVRNLSPSVFHFLKAAFLSFFFALLIQLRNSIWKNSLKKTYFCRSTSHLKNYFNFWKIESWYNLLIRLAQGLCYKEPNLFIIITSAE